MALEPIGITEDGLGIYNGGCDECIATTISNGMNGKRVQHHPLCPMIAREQAKRDANNALWAARAAANTRPQPAPVRPEPAEEGERVTWAPPAPAEPIIATCPNCAERFKVST